jgi:arginine/lysine/ornithine decarboxylase
LRNLDVEEFEFCREDEPDFKEIETGVTNDAKDCECNNYNLNSEKNEISISIFDALNSETEEVLLENSVGRVAGAALCIYPPGINLVNPGEIITENVVQDLKSGMRHGLEVLGVDTELMVKVII